MGTPNTATAPRPAESTPMTHGRQISRGHPGRGQGQPEGPSGGRRSRKTAEESSRASATRTTTTAAAGTKEIITASMQTECTAPRKWGWRAVHAAIRCRSVAPGGSSR